MTDEQFDQMSRNDKWLASDINYLEIHKNRYKQSLLYIEDILKKSNHILELGYSDNKNYFPKFINTLYPHIQIDYTYTDLRYDFLSDISNEYDLILCMETIEHIKDNETNDRFDMERFIGSGISNLLINCYRLVKNGGILFITTPNVNSYHSISKILSHSHPFSYEPHVREMSVGDIKSHLHSAGWCVENFKLTNCWNVLEENKVKTLQVMLSTFGYSIQDREDCIFIRAIKI
jgi:SAM-dependent methyltransferase